MSRGRLPIDIRISAAALPKRRGALISGPDRIAGWCPKQSVITGLDPVIHPLRKTFPKMDGCAGQARA
jgi:hypothetical protein